jgi:hypothetical protein
VRVNSTLKISYQGCPVCNMLVCKWLRELPLIAVHGRFSLFRSWINPHIMKSCFRLRWIT